MRARKHFIALGWLGLALLASCGKGGSTAHKHQEIVINLRKDPVSLHPNEAIIISDTNVARMLFDGLMRMDQNGVAQPAVAERVESFSDGLSYRFHLRKTYWSDGQPVTAHNFVYSWQQTLSPDSKHPLAPLLYIIKNGKQAHQGIVPPEEIGVRALDDSTLEVVLEHPIPYLLELLAAPIAFPVPTHIDQKDSHWAEQPETFVGNGPFSPQVWKRTDALVVVRNELYWDRERVGLDKITCWMIEPALEAMLFEQKKLDWAGSPNSHLPADALASLEGRPEFHRTPVLSTVFIRLNVLHPLLAEADARRALSFALDRRNLSLGLLGDPERASSSLLPVSLRNYADTDPLEGDRAVAKALWQKANASVNSDQPFRLVYAAGETTHRWAQALREQWRAVLGIDVELRPLERQCYKQALRNGDFEMAFGDWIADVPDANNFLELFASVAIPSNNTHWERPEYRMHLEAACHLADPVARARELSQCEEILVREAPILPLYQQSQIFLCNKGLTGVVLTSVGTIDFKEARKEPR